jgi:hypothetical protein
LIDFKVRTCQRTYIKVLMSLWRVLSLKWEPTYIHTYARNSSLSMPFCNMCFRNNIINIWTRNQYDYIGRDFAILEGNFHKKKNKNMFKMLMSFLPNKWKACSRVQFYLISRDQCWVSFGNIWPLFQTFLIILHGLPIFSKR